MHGSHDRKQNLYHDKQMVKFFKGKNLMSCKRVLLNLYTYAKSKVFLGAAPGTNVSEKAAPICGG